MAAAYDCGFVRARGCTEQVRASLTLGQQLAGAYDAAIEALEAGSGQRACDALTSLVDIIHSERRRFSGGLSRICRYCIEEIKRGELAVPGAVLKELRGTWSQVLLTS